MNGKTFIIDGKPYEKPDLDWDSLREEDAKITAMTDEELDAAYPELAELCRKVRREEFMEVQRKIV